MTKEEIDVMWQLALKESVRNGEEFTRYRFAEMVAAKELEARKATQVENEKLKEMLAKSGIETRRAVLEEREACAELCEHFGGMNDGYSCASAIRARTNQ